MKISLKQLKILVAIARYQTVTAAAAHCFVTQAAASMALLQLEQHLQQKLFIRKGKKLLLSRFGQKVLPLAEEVLMRVSDLEQLSDQGELNGTLHVGASRTWGSYILPPIIASFSKKHPKVQINLQCENSKKIGEQVQQATIDLGFIETSCELEAVNFESLLTDRLQLFSRKKHPLIKVKKLKLKDLLVYPWIMRETGSGTRNIVQLALQKLDITPPIKIICNDVQAILDIVKNTDSIGCVSEYVLNEYHRDMSVLPLNILNLTRELYVITLQQAYQSQLAIAFLGAVKATLMEKLALN
jgi:DNA-binding transcriptional LysR family regulator